MTSSLRLADRRWVSSFITARYIHSVELHLLGSLFDIGHLESHGSLNRPGCLAMSGSLFLYGFPPTSGSLFVSGCPVPHGSLRVLGWLLYHGEIVDCAESESWCFLPKYSSA